MFHSLSVMVDNFAGHISLGWLPSSFRTWNIFLHILLAFKISIEKLAVILVGFSSYVTCICSLVAFNTISLFCIVSVLTMPCFEYFLFNIFYLVPCVFLVSYGCVFP